MVVVVVGGGGGVNMCSLHNLYSQFTSCITSISHKKINIQIPVYKSSSIGKQLKA